MSSSFCKSLGRGSVLNRCVSKKVVALRCRVYQLNCKGWITTKGRLKNRMKHRPGLRRSLPPASFGSFFDSRVSLRNKKASTQERNNIEAVTKFGNTYGIL